MAESGGLENRCAVYAAPWVQIPLSPPKNLKNPLDKFTLSHYSINNTQKRRVIDENARRFWI